MPNKPFVSIIIPCFQEKNFIGRCLDSLIQNSYPKEKLEILVMDGESTDKTREIIKEYEEKYPFIRLKDNPQRFQPFALNKGIKEAKGDIIIRCDAHAEYSKNYIEKLVYWLQKDRKIGNVGGIWINRPTNDSLKAKAITYTLAHPFCVGPNRYRIGVKKPTFVDTVPFGAWRKEIFDKVGFFNEKFIRAQDLEFNLRLKKAGYKILLDPEIKIIYYPRDSFKKLFLMMFQYAYWKLIVNKKLKIISSFRQFAPPIFILYLFSAVILSFLSPLVWLPLGVYLILTLIFSLQLALKHKDLKIFPFSFWSFVISHIGYGLGYLKGVLDVYLKKEKSLDKKYTKITR